MPEGLFRRARAFIGLEEGERKQSEVNPQMDMNAILRNKRNNDKSEGDYEVILYEPKVYEDSLGISSEIRRGNPVIVNLKSLEPEEGTRLVDFVCGTAYAIDGHMIKIGESIFLFTPKNILITDMQGKEAIESEPVELTSKTEAFFEGN